MFRNPIKLVFVLLILMTSHASWANSYPSCGGSMTITGLPSAPVSISPNTPFNLVLTVTGAMDFRAERYTVEWLTSPKNGSLNAVWQEPNGTTRQLFITYTPSATFTPGVVEDLKFRIKHPYGDVCFSNELSLVFYNEQCNGAFMYYGASHTVDPITIAWGTGASLWYDFHTLGYSAQPDYKMVMLQSPTSGTTKDVAFSPRPEGGIGKRLSFLFAHASKSYGADQIRFRIEDNTISNAATRAACGKEITVNLEVQADTETSCSSFNVRFEGMLLGETLTGYYGSGVLAIVGGNTFDFNIKLSNDVAVNPTYLIYYGSPNLVAGSLNQINGGTSLTRTYRYTRYQNPTTNFDTTRITVKMTDGATVCEKTTFMVFSTNPCEAFDFDPFLHKGELYIEPGASVPVTAKVIGGTGPYTFKITSILNNGTMNTLDSGQTQNNRFDFIYQHNSADTTSGDTVSIVATDHATGCVITKEVKINPDMCARMGTIGSSVISVNKGTAALTSTFAFAARGSRSLVFKVSPTNPPTKGTIANPESGIIVAPDDDDMISELSYAFNYTNNTAEDDSFTVIAYDPQYPQCRSEHTVTVSYCSSFGQYFSTYVTPNPLHSDTVWPTVVVGGETLFTAYAKAGSGQYSFDISQQPSHGTISSRSTYTIIKTHNFYYKHNGIANAAVTSDTFTIRIRDVVNNCSKEFPVVVYINPCGAGQSVVSSASYWASMTDPTVFWAEIPHGSGDYTFTPRAWKHYATAYSPVTTLHREVTGTKVRQYFSFQATERADYSVRVTVTDNSNPTSCTFTPATRTLKANGSHSSCGNIVGPKVIGINEPSVNDNYNVGASDTKINLGQSHDFQLQLIGGDINRQYDFSVILKNPAAEDYPEGGRVISLGQGANALEHKFRYTAGSRYPLRQGFKPVIQDRNDPLCQVTLDFWYYITVRDQTNTCTSSGVSNNSSVILDNTANGGYDAISTNLNFVSGCAKSESTVGVKPAGSQDINGQGINTINIWNFRVVNPSEQFDKITVSVGNPYYTVSKNLAQTPSRATKHFADGSHLFDLDRFRQAADWLYDTTTGTSNVTPISSLTEGTYGTITMQQFLENIRDGKVMHGITRVLVGLQKGACAPNCGTAKNSQGDPVSEANLYGYCAQGNTAGLCACAPSRRTDRPLGHFDAIKPGVALCKDSENNDISLPSRAKIMVKGALLWDFVDYQEKDANGHYKTIPLAELPYFPRELYYMVDIPIIVNSAFNGDYCGGANYLGCTTGNSISNEFSSSMTRVAGASYDSNAQYGGVYRPFGSSNVNSITLDMIPPTSRNYYQYRTGQDLNQDRLNALPASERFHLMMPNGYTLRWSEAFRDLNLTAGNWKALGFKIPTAAPLNTPLEERMIRNDQFEDIPVYMYSGGLIDMHHHVNISGLVYVPQALEIEADAGSGIRQYVIGALVVRDGFYLEARSASIMVLSSDPETYSSAQTLHPSAQNTGLIQSNTGTGPLTTNSNSSSSSSNSNTPQNVTCLYCPAASSNSAGGGGGAATQPPRMWRQIFPQ